MEAVQSTIRQNNAVVSLDSAIARRIHTREYPVTLALPFGADCSSSSIVLPLYQRDGQLFVRMTQRASSMRTFAGQLVFPGGKREGRETPVETARREYSEELGCELSPGQYRGDVCPLYRQMDDGRYIEISPVLFQIDPHQEFRCSPDEVESVVDVAVYPYGREAQEFAQTLKGATKLIFEALGDVGDTLLGELQSVPLRHQAQLPLRMVVTSGGTRVPVDTVRVMTNESAGTTGALIAEQAMVRGHLVHYLCSKDTNTPFQRDFTLDPRRTPEEEISRVTANAHRLFPLFASSEVERVKTFDAYRTRLLELCAKNETDVVILAMAASDYGPEATTGKISSDKDDLTITLKPLPKIISEVKRERPGIFLVGFKLLVNRSPDALIDAAYRSILRDHQDLAVANVGQNSMRPSELLTYIVTGERGVIPVRREDLDRRLCSIIEDRFSRRHFKTNLETLSSLPITQETEKDFISACHWVSELALFDTYTEGERGEFGFIAKRTEEGTLITARGSSKSEATVDDLALVRGVDLERLTIDVASTGKKAALNASLAHLIFEQRPEIKYIVHAHVSLPEAIVVPRDSSPSTAEDWERMADIVKAGHSIIEQPHHGVCILLESLHDLPAILERNSIYTSNAGHYDKAYHRFLGSAALVDIFSDRVAPGEPILDLCSGTGEVSRELLARGFSDITLCDASPAMNQVARTKLEHFIPSEKIHTAAMEELPYREEFGGVIMRQAVNYIAPGDLVATFQKIGAALRPGGTFVFNSFVLDDSFSGKVRRRRDEVDHSIVRTCEGNLIRDGKVYHGQKTEIFDAYSGAYTSVYDLNSFWIYSPEEFEVALKKAGAQSIVVTRKDNSVYFECQW